MGSGTMHCLQKTLRRVNSSELTTEHFCWSTFYILSILSLNELSLFERKDGTYAWEPYLCFPTGKVGIFPTPRKKGE